MTETEQKALALLRECAEVPAYVNLKAIPDFVRAALFRAIEQHEAFRQEVSDAVVTTYNNGCSQRPYVSPRDYMDGLRRFIIAKPDPLVDAWNDMFPRGDCGNCVDAEVLRAAIEKRGGKIVWGEG